ncbi:helix-turn-helix domain-containing protein [Paenibacillus sp. MMO-58]|uniref:helix-turn-helix domain-containing protein n=1 Tax=Paenibacillus sp. MMO-58 TaxID=3081290 RepID=UPI00301B044B
MENLNRIREIRKSKNISGVEVANKLGISTQYLYDIEKYKRGLSSEIISQLCDIFKVTSDYLIGKSDVNLYEEQKNLSSDKEERLRSILQLTDKEISDKFQVILDGRELTDSEIRMAVAFLRTNRQMSNGSSDNSNS